MDKYLYIVVCLLTDKPDSPTAVGDKFWKLCERRTLRVNVRRMVDDRMMNVALNGKLL